jgi:hypothetical protein
MSWVPARPVKAKDVFTSRVPAVSIIIASSPAVEEHAPAPAPGAKAKVVGAMVIGAVVRVDAKVEGDASRDGAGFPPGGPLIPDKPGTPPGPAPGRHDKEVEEGSVDLHGNSITGFAVVIS